MFYTDYCAIGAGQLLSGLDPKLQANGWELIDTPDAGRKIYFSPGLDLSENIYLELNDQAANWISLKVGTGYDPVTHSLLNPTSVKNTLKAATVATPYWLSVTENRIILATRCNRALPNFYDTAYAGLLLKYKPSHADSQVVIGGASTVTAEGVRHQAALNQECGRICKTHVGEVNVALAAVSLNACFGATQLPNQVDGMMMMSPIVIGINNAALFGELDGLYSALSAGVASEEVFTWNGKDYIIIISSTTATAIEKK